MNKIKILVIGNDFNGCGYYRINAPYLSINDSDLEIKYLPTSDFTFKFDEENLKDVNIIVYHKYLPLKNNIEFNEFIRIRQKYDIKVIYDIDDYWVLENTHPNFNKKTNEELQKQTIGNLRFANYVTTTTPILANKIKEINNNVVVLENAINTKEQQWTPNKIKSDKTRFLWGGGITHLHDLELLKQSLNTNNKDMLDNIQLYMCGYDLRTEDPITKKMTITPPHNSIWTEFEKIFTNNYKSIKNTEYLSWLKEYTDNGDTKYGYNEKFKNEFYQRRWSKPILIYGTMYNETDVVLSPLEDNQWNSMKSQLKIIEAGIHKCPIISSNNLPYTMDIIDGKNGFLIDTNNKSHWYDKMMFFVNNPNAIVDMGESLHELILEKYTLEVVNKKRVEFLKSIIK